MRVRAVGTQGGLVPQDERDLDDSGRASRHQRVAEDGVDHGADHQVLRVRGHGITGQEDDDSGHQVTLRAPVPVAAQPDTQETRAPPDNAHGGVLQVIVDPRASPSVFGKGVDAPPGRDDQGVEEFLTPTRATQPVLADEEENGEEDSVRDEGTAHDEVGQALSHVVILAETQRRDPPKHHLDPSDQRHRLPEYPVCNDKHAADASVDAFRDVQFEVEAEDDLHDHHEHQDVRERVMGVLAELAAFMGVTEEIGDDGDTGRDNLKRNVPPRAHDLYRIRKKRQSPALPQTIHPTVSTLLRKETYPENHAQRKQDAKGKSHQNHMNP